MRIDDILFKRYEKEKEQAAVAVQKAARGRDARKAAKGKATAAKGTGKHNNGVAKAGTSQIHDPKFSPGPTPKAGTARPGGGTHGAGDKSKLKRLARAKADIRWKSNEGRKKRQIKKRRLV